MKLIPNRSWKNLKSSVIIDIICRPRFMNNKKQDKNTQKNKDLTTALVLRSCLRD